MPFCTETVMWLSALVLPPSVVNTLARLIGHVRVTESGSHDEWLLVDE